jgi:hypothetical protein
LKHTKVTYHFCIDNLQGKHGLMWMGQYKLNLAL